MAVREDTVAAAAATAVAPQATPACRSPVAEDTEEENGKKSTKQYLEEKRGAHLLRHPSFVVACKFLRHLFVASSTVCCDTLAGRTGRVEMTCLYVIL